MTSTVRIVVLAGLLFMFVYSVTLGERHFQTSLGHQVALTQKADTALREVVHPVMKGRVEVLADKVIVDGSIDEKGLSQILTSFLHAQYQIARLQKSVESYRFAMYTFVVFATVVMFLVCAFLYPRLRATLRINRTLSLELEGARKMTQMMRPESTAASEGKAGTRGAAP